MKCASSLSIYNSFDILQEWQSELQSSTGDIVFDMSDLEDIDTAGVQLLLALKKECIETDRSIKMIGWREDIIPFLRLVGCQQLLDLEGERDE